MSAEAVLAAALLAGLANTAYHLLYHRAPLYLDPRSVLGDAARRAPRASDRLLVVVAALAILAFGAGLRPIPAAAVALTAIVVLRGREIATWPGDVVVRLGKYAPASACLLGWSVAHVLATLLGADEAEARAHGWDAAAGVFGACYLLAALAKVQSSGWSWGRAEHMSLMLAERGFGRFGGLRLWLAQSRPACGLIGFTGMAVELAGPLLVWAPARPALAVVVVTFKAFTWMLFGYFEPEWTLAVIAIGLAAAS